MTSLFLLGCILTHGTSEEQRLPLLTLLARASGCAVEAGAGAWNCVLANHETGECTKGSRAGELGYGEVAPEGVESMLAFLNEPVGTEDILVDLGSGCGRVAAQAFVATTARRIVGIELVETRHRDAALAAFRGSSDSRVEARERGCTGFVDMGWCQ